ncbi:hypothetical protein CEXT_699441 [Caerostris extrusa]|uniref:Maturase K n=1 Tax=Caerostris extrusa TaxID=172846 RepID=A0AAV4W5X6_CAEEX|nr:hypothetical protein CEXT_699441 [Caerostris extrusa]
MQLPLFCYKCSTNEHRLQQAQEKSPINAPLYYRVLYSALENTLCLRFKFLFVPKNEHLPIYYEIRGLRLLIAERERDSTQQANTPDSTERQLGSIHKKTRQRDLIIFLRVPHANVDSFGDSAAIRLSESFAFYSGRYAKKEMTFSSTPLPSPLPRAPRELYHLNIYY